jgi:hypothetical protein
MGCHPPERCSRAALRGEPRWARTSESDVACLHLNSEVFDVCAASMRKCSRRPGPWRTAVGATPQCTNTQKTCHGRARPRVWCAPAARVSEWDDRTVARRIRECSDTTERMRRSAPGIGEPLHSPATEVLRSRAPRHIDRVPLGNGSATRSTLASRFRPGLALSPGLVGLGLLNPRLRRLRPGLWRAR